MADSASAGEPWNAKAIAITSGSVAGSGSRSGGASKLGATRNMFSVSGIVGAKARPPRGPAWPGDRHRDPPHLELAQPLEAVLECGHDAEVAAAPAQRPQELWIAVFAGPDDLAIGRDDLRADQRVAGEPARSHQVADPAGQCQAGDSRVDERASGRRQAVGGRRRVEVEPLAAALGVGDPSLRVDRDAAHVAQVDDEGVVGDAVTGDAVAAAAHRDRQAGRPGRRGRPPRRRTSNGTGRSPRDACRACR
jgi:hypothetical protein